MVEIKSRGPISDIPYERSDNLRAAMALVGFEARDLNRAYKSVYRAAVTGSISGGGGEGD